MQPFPATMQHCITTGKTGTYAASPVIWRKMTSSRLPPPTNALKLEGERRNLTRKTSLTGKKIQGQEDSGMFLP
jgi:hypothetical protein